jgi:putative ABC transport system permease protein
MEWLAHDFRYAYREVTRRPGFTILAVLTLAMGIGAATTMYSVIYNVLLNPFPYTDPRRMVDVIIQDAENPERIGGALAIPEFRAFIDQSRVFEDAVGTSPAQMLYRTDHGPEQFTAASVTPNLFRFLGVPALIGRTPNPEDTRVGSSRVAVLSHRAWMKYFGGDPAVLGRAMVLDDLPMTIVGVMPPRFTWHVADVWIPDAADRSSPDTLKKAFWLQGRLQPGLSLADAQARLNVIASRRAREYPERYPFKRFSITVITVIDWVVGRFRGVLYTLFGAVGLLLLIACCNVANMLLARGTAREGELAIRSALGATRSRIVGQMLIESLLLALGGGALGIVFAYGGISAVRMFIPPYAVPVETEISMRLPVLVFSLAIATLTALLFGVAPALRSTRNDLTSRLSSSGRGGESGSRHGNLRNLLVVSEVTLSLVLLTGAGVLMRGFFSMVHLDLGFNPHNLLVTRISLPNATTAQQQEFFEAAFQRIGSLPGVLSVGITNSVPAYGGIQTDIEVAGKPHADRWTGQFQLCNESYFQTIGLRLLRGSTLSRGDVRGGRKVAVVNETFVRKYLGNDDPIGKRVQLTRLHSGKNAIPDPTFEIVGVVVDIRNQGVEESTAAEAMIPFTVAAFDFPRVIVRTSSDARMIATTIRGEIHAINANVVQHDPMTVDDMLREWSYARPRFSVFLMGMFSILGLTLVGTGVYGVLAYTVSRRTREIGIRMALGADQVQVFGSVFGMAFRLIGGGVILGGLASFATNRIISNQVWAVVEFDPVTLIGAIAVIAILGGAACFVPALRATRVHPAIALRHE